MMVYCFFERLQVQAAALGLENLYGRELEGQQQLLRMCSE